MSEQTEPTSLQYRLLLKKVADLSPLAKARKEYVERLQLLRRDPPPVTPP